MIRETLPTHTTDFEAARHGDAPIGIWPSVRAPAFERVAAYVLLIAGLCAATIVITWPHARVFTTHVVSNIDPLFSMWRLAWFAHAIERGEHLLHANTFYPEPFTYLLSDATLLQGALAAPAIWSGVALPSVYNALLLLGILSSGVAMYWVATSLGIRRPAAVLAAMVFSLAPYRIEHIMHLELQWAAPAILAFGSLYQILYAPRWKHGVVLGLAVWLQFLAAVYYAVFLLPILLALVVASWTTLPDWRSTCRAGLLAAALCAVLTMPIARLYMQQGARVGERPIGDISTYSATPWSYLASPQENTLYGGTADRWGAGEKRLFPGVLALSLAAIGLLSARRRTAIAALIVTLLSMDLSFGVNGLIYPRLLEWWPVLHGLRAPARYGIFVLAGIAVLAALGFERLAERARRANISATLLAAIAIVAACVEYRSPQYSLLRVDMDPPVYRFLRQLPEGVVLELPLPPYSGDAALDADYVFWSTSHWRKLVNGYSGYYPPSYQATLDRLQSLPDEDSLALLRERHVRYILVHLTYIKRSEGASLLAEMLARPELRSLGSYNDWAGSTAVFELIR
jgi:hypothetical protein